MNELWFGILLICTTLMAWTYAAYPLIIRALSFRGKPVKKTEYYPSISIIIPTYNEASLIGKKIRNTQALFYPREKLEIIVVDDCSNDKTVEIAREFDTVNVIPLKEREQRKIGALNKGLEAASGDIVVLSDADCFLDRDALIFAASNFGDESVGAVTGRLLSLNSTTQHKLKINESLLDSLPSGVGAFLAFRKKLVEKLDPRSLSDDFEISLLVRAKGYRVVYEPRINVMESNHPKNFKVWYKQSVRRTVYGLVTLFHHKSMLFNPAYGWYGLLMLPRALLDHLSPYLLLAGLFSFIMIFPLHYVMIACIVMIAGVLLKPVRKFLIWQIVSTNAWILYFLKKYDRI